MTLEQTKTKIEEKCPRCQEEGLIVDVMLPLSEITETGQIIYPNETKDMSIQVPVKLCLRCMFLASEGFIGVCKIPNKNELKLFQISDGIGQFSLEFFEKEYKEGRLTNLIDEQLKELKLTRNQVKKQKKKKTPLRIAIIVEESYKK